MHSAKGMGAPTPATCSSVDDEFDRQITAGSSFFGAFDAELNALPPLVPPGYFVDCGTTKNYTDIAEFPGSCAAVAEFSTCPAVVPSEGVGYQSDVRVGIQRNYQGLATNSDLDSQTTLMVRNLTPDLTQPEFLQHLIDGGYRGLFDFIYMPMNRGRGNRGLFDNLQGRGNFGYAFVNFGSHTIAAQVMARLQDSEKGDPLCSLEWTAVWSTCQGFEANIDRYRNSPLMHHVVPNDAKPSVYDSWGNLATFPTPTKAIPKPRIHQPHPKEDMATSKNV